MSSSLHAGNDFDFHVNASKNSTAGWPINTTLVVLCILYKQQEQTQEGNSGRKSIRAKFN